MNLIGNNLRQRDQLRKLTTPAQVRAEIERCERGQRAAPSYAKTAEWSSKLQFLDKLLRQLERAS